MKSVKKISDLASHFWQKAFLLITFTVLTFSVIHFLSLALMATSESSGMSRNLIMDYVTFNLTPAAAIYVTVMAVMYYFYKKTSKKINDASVNEIEEARKKATVETIQKMTALIAEQMARPNAELRQWVLNRKAAGSAPEQVERASAQIGRALEQLTWAGYVVPYTGSNKNNNDEDPSRIIHRGPEHGQRFCFPMLKGNR